MSNLEFSNCKIIWIVDIFQIERCKFFSHPLELKTITFTTTITVKYTLDLTIINTSLIIPWGQSLRQ